ncbi:N-acetylneuraminate epimerase [BD1-7 clade bacterium]|uniref:N-acetylneuraminate epimerase n=1 Tax=BD1-7 clade bacterium TaxID=2029982 RepID=A0A5S9P204_9GAMM|nr:N-acetylneuraminate epimerase [BD1-7 clade bacterium]CAA0116407.1 N-acetylneuraminate epimerase [BD1-7 clade bacterium]CAA0120063.1 N-acetylneuraminate epimerase [BD1-7 clade bacterium]
MIKRSLFWVLGSTLLITACDDNDNDDRGNPFVEGVAQVTSRQTPDSAELTANIVPGSVDPSAPQTQNKLVSANDTVILIRSQQPDCPTDNVSGCINGEQDVIDGSIIQDTNLLPEKPAWIKIKVGDQVEEFSVNVLKNRKSHALVNLDKKLMVIGGKVDDTLTNDILESKNLGRSWRKLTPSTAVFSPRKSHKVTMHNGMMIMTAGKNENGATNHVWMSKEGKKWEDITPASGEGFPARWSHEALSHLGKLYVFGGVTDASGVKQVLDDIWESADNGKTWQQVTTEGRQWLARKALSAASHLGYIYLMGGENDARNAFDDLWRSIDGKKWEHLLPAADLKRRTSHKLISHLGKLYLMGGKGHRDNPDETKTYMNDVMMSADLGMSWTTIVADRVSGTDTQNRDRSALVFSPRSAFDVASVDDKMVMVGGNHDRKGGFNDVHIATGDMTEWMKIHAARKPLDHREAHALVSHGDKLIAMGGNNGDKHTAQIHTSDDDGKTWQEIRPAMDITDTAPTGRALHHLMSFKNALYVLGGKNSDKDMEHAVLKSTDDGETWQDISALITGVLPAGFGLAGHAATVHDGKMIISGGEKADGSINDKIMMTENGVDWTELTPSCVINPQMPDTECNFKVTGHSMASHDGNIVMMGGKTPAQGDPESMEIISQVLTTDDGGMNWMPLQTSGLAPVTAHKLVSTGDDLVATGGITTESEDAQTLAPAMMISGDDGKTWEALHDGFLFSKRKFHQALIHKGELLVSAGANEFGEILSDFWAIAVPHSEENTANRHSVPITRSNSFTMCFGIAAFIEEESNKDFKAACRAFEEKRHLR